MVTTCSPSSRKLVESLKPDSALNYHDNLIQHLTETYRDKPFDLIYDTVGVGAIYHASPAFLKPEGKYIDIAGSASMKGAKDIGWVILGMLNKLVRPTWLGGTPRKYEFHSASFTDVVRPHFPSPRFGLRCSPTPSLFTISLCSTGFSRKLPNSLGMVRTLSPLPPLRVGVGRPTTDIPQIPRYLPVHH